MGGEGRREITSREEEEAQAQVDIWKYVFGFTDMAVVKCAIELGIPDVLESHGGPMTLSELSSVLGCSSTSALHRVMRFLVHRRIFKEDPTSQGSIGYAQTPLSQLLMRHGKNSLADLLLLESSPVMVGSWHSLSARVLSIETSSFEAAHGKDVWSLAAANPAQMKLIDDAMACDARVVAPAIIEGCPELFGGVNCLVDVGGGNGTALSILVKACPWIQGINFDLPHVVAAAPNCVGVEHVGGDMFDKVPKADAAFLMWVLHDWGDDECIQILRKCRKAIPDDKGKVIIVEAVIEEGEGDKLKYVRLMLDMVMMAHTKTGKERTLKEWVYLLREAGFSRYTVNRIQAVQSVIEAYP
ncbi:acetylserotonin O-methyltransferase-like [Cornus florida]|uniref:acetylserotonin O-methyltransferase-like n=1 Tax=Cornus florida TaxID=4283 RepID=UPI0028A09D01|nr:acetylserotonin O-methyltransferase-like [Cornus florida]